jgi:uncharacterized protein (TIGR02996 family)
MSNAQGFELALVEEPDDLAGWCAYADWLAEHEGPRGEFMQVQIALEDAAHSTAERKALAEREAELLAAHEREWLGPLATHLLDRDPEDLDEYGSPRTRKVEYRWARGFLAEIKADCLTVALAQALADAPTARLLRRLHVVSTAYYLSMEDDTTPRRVPGPPEHQGIDEWLELLGAPLLRSLRVFQMGDVDGEPPEDSWCDNHTYVPGIERLVSEMAHVEELHLLCKEYDCRSLFGLPNLDRLRLLRMYSLGRPYAQDDEYEIPLDVLATNRALGNLTHLLLHPHFAFGRSFIPLGRVGPLLRSKHLRSLTHLQLRLSDMGDAGVSEIVASGILKRLKVLDLRHGAITDDGARLFAGCPDTRQLEWLDLSRNAVTAAGLALLQRAGVNADASRPLTPQELADRQYLHEGDFE